MKNLLKLCCLCFVFSVIGIISSYPQTEVPVLKVGYVEHDHQTALYVACLEGKRFEKDYGIYLKPIKEKSLYEMYEGDKKIAEIEIYVSGGGSKMPTMLSQGHFEIGLGGVTAVAVFVDKGAPMKIISPLHTKGDMLVVKPLLNLNNWGEFCDWVKKQDNQVRMGYKNPAAVAKIIFEGALKQENITFTGDKGDTKAKILMINMKGEENLIPGLQNDIVDGYVSNNPWCAIAESKGVGKIVCELHTLPPGTWKDHACCCVAATNKVITEKPELVSKFLELIIIATKYMNEEPEIGYRSASQWLGTSLDVEKKSMPTSGYSTELNDDWKEGLYQQLKVMEDLGEIKDKLKSAGPKEIDELLFDFAPLKKSYRDLENKKKQ